MLSHAAWNLGTSSSMQASDYDTLSQILSYKSILSSSYFASVQLPHSKYDFTEFSNVSLVASILHCPFSSSSLLESSSNNMRCSYMILNLVTSFVIMTILYSCFFHEFSIIALLYLSCWLLNICFSTIFHSMTPKEYLSCSSLEYLLKVRIGEMDFHDMCLTTWLQV